MHWKSIGSMNLASINSRYRHMMSDRWMYIQSIKSIRSVKKKNMRNSYRNLIPTQLSLS